MAKSQATDATAEEFPPTVNEKAPLPEVPAEPEAAPAGMWAGSPAESEAMIGERRAGIQDAQRRLANANAEINRLQNEIAVLNSLRQANGQGPL